MPYSLLSRFHGGLLGSLIGEMIANNALLGNPQLVNPATEKGRDRALSPWHQISFRLSQHLIEKGNLSDEDWQALWEQQLKLLPRNQSISSGEIAVGILPLTLFFHDSLDSLRQYLESLQGLGKLPREIMEDNLIWAYGIILALREKLDRDRFIPQLLDHFPTAQTSLIQSLQEIPTFLAKATPLETVIARLSRLSSKHSASIALALYCFSCTPEDSHLCLLRAAKTGGNPYLTTVLTGILVGIYNSYIGIPIHWRFLMEQYPIFQEIYQQGTDLLAVWSGIYELTCQYDLKAAAIAAPLTFQPRPSLKIISQGEYYS